MEAMNDDLNTPNAYMLIFDVVKEMNQLLRQKEISQIDILMENFKIMLLKMLSFLGLRLSCI